MEVLDLFSAAAGGWSLGMHRAGFTTVAACEVEAWRRALYAENNPHVRLYDDVRTLTADRLRDDLGRLPSIVVGSPPCQDISSANTKGRGVEGARSGLYFEAIRIIGEVRPRWFALENSANLRTRGADAVISALEAIGYACEPCVVRAEDIDANHERPRAWLIGYDVAQVADPDGLGWDEGWRGRRVGFDMAVSADPRDATQDGCGQGIPGRRVEPVERVSVAPCGDAADTAGEGYGRRGEIRSGREARHQHEGNHARAGAGTVGGGNPADPDQARQAHGCGARRCADGTSAGQMGLCPPDRGVVDRSGPDWSLAHLADHLRVDDGLSAWLAEHRVQIGDGKGQSAASLVVEAFGDAVIPQIPEAIGRAILRVEAAMSAVHGRLAA